MLIKKLDKHIGSEILAKCALAGFWLLCLYSFVALIELLDRYESSGDFLTIAYLLALSLPRQVQDLMPMIMTLGTLLGLANLSRHSELIAFQASSVSRYRIAASVLSLTGIIAVGTTLWGEIVVPNSERASERIRISLKDDGRGEYPSVATWLRDGNLFVNFLQTDEFGALSRISVFELSDAGELKSKSVASLGRIYPEEQSLSLFDADRYVLREGALSMLEIPEMVIPVSASEVALKSLFRSPGQMSVQELYEVAQYRAANGKNSDVFAVEIWNRLTFPILTILMVACVISFGFKGGRRSGASFYIFLGIVIGLFFFAVQQSVSYVVLLNGFSPAIGIGTTLLIFFTGAVFSMLKLNHVLR